MAEQICVIKSLFEQKKKPLLEEKSQLANETHATYLRELQKIKAEYDREFERADIMEKDVIERIESAYQLEIQSIDRDYEQRLSELVECLYNEYEEKKRLVESEVNSLDIVTTSSGSANYYYGFPNKKMLRRRANEQPDPGEKKPRKHSPQNIVHLLPDSVIAEDVKLLCSYQSTSASAGSLIAGGDEEGRHRKVVFENSKLICDGKNFHRGQNVSIQTVNYGRFSAIIQTICDNYVQFRSSMKGDTRQVTATKDDLECGRVIVRKRY